MGAKVIITDLAAGETYTAQAGFEALSVNNLGAADAQVTDTEGNNKTLISSAAVNVPYIGGKSYESMSFAALTSTLLIIEIR